MAAQSVLEKKKAHAKRRFDERYGIRLDDNLSKVLIDRIQRRDRAERLCTMSNRVTVWSVYIGPELMRGAKLGTMVPMAYDKERKILITALPPNCKEMINYDIAHD